MDKEVEDIVEKIYLTPNHEGSFSSAAQIQRILKEKYNKSATLKKIQTWLSTQRAYNLHKTVRHVFPRNPTIAEYIDQQWQADLMFLPDLGKFNDGFHIALVCIDIVSRFAWVEPMKNKTALSTCNAMQAIINRAIPRIPEKLQTDDGKEFLNSKFQDLMTEHQIIHFTTSSDKKAAVAERFNRTLKDKIYRYLDVNPTNNVYVNVLQDLVNSYNNSFHTSIGMAPAQVNESNSGRVLWKLYHHLWAKDRGPKKRKLTEDENTSQVLKVGDTVRISGEKHPFVKGYKGNWTEEVFTITAFKKSVPHYVYRIQDFNGEPIKGTFYNYQLQKIQTPDKDDLWQIEKVLKTRKRSQKLERLVKWFGYSDKFNSWVADEDIHST